jgi:hypothetical protein
MDNKNNLDKYKESLSKEISKELKELNIKETFKKTDTTKLITDAYFSKKEMKINEHIVNKISFKDEVSFNIDNILEITEGKDLMLEFHYNQFDHIIKMKVNIFNKNIILSKIISHKTQYNPSNLKTDNYAIAKVSDNFIIANIIELNFNEILLKTLKKEEDLLISNLGNQIPLSFENETFKIISTLDIKEVNEQNEIIYKGEVKFETEAEMKKYKKMIDLLKSKEDFKSKENELENLIQEGIKS